MNPSVKMRATICFQGKICKETGLGDGGLDFALGGAGDADGFRERRR
jgi:hypothetical protein